MKEIASIVVFLLAGILSSSFLDIWWDVTVIAFLVSMLFRLSPGKGFGYLFIGGALLWGGLTAIAGLRYESTLMDDLSSLFQVGSAPLFILVIAITGGLLAGLSGWTGASLIRLTGPKNR